MMRNFPRQNFEPLCHNGGDYHACDSTRFVGCCDVNPCVAGGGCNVDALKPMSFQKNLFSMAFHDQVCSTGSWYTCADTIPPFIGCCKSNPCATTSGCPDGDLVQGSLSSNPYDAALWFSVAKLDSPATTSAPALATSASSGHNLNGGAIAGLALGLAALVIFLVAALFFYRRRKAVATESRGYETKNLVEAHLTEMYPTPSRGDAASGVHEAPVTNVAPKEFRSSGYPDSLYPSPTPAYSPYNPVSELETPVSTFHNDQNFSRQSAELPSPDTRSLVRQHNVGSVASVDSLGTSQAFRQSPLTLSPPGHFEAYSSKAHSN